MSACLDTDATYIQLHTSVYLVNYLVVLNCFCISRTISRIFDQSINIQIHDILRNCTKARRSTCLLDLIKLNKRANKSCWVCMNGKVCNGQRSKFVCLWQQQALLISQFFTDFQYIGIPAIRFVRVPYLSVH